MTSAPRSASRRSSRPTTPCRIPRSASSTTPAADSPALAPEAFAGGGGFPGGAAGSPRTSATSSPRSCAGAVSRGRGSSVAVTSRRRSASASTRRCTEPRSRSRCRRPASARPATGVGRSRGPLRAPVRAARGPASTPRARASSRSRSPAPNAAARAAIIDDPCPTCSGSGVTQETKRYRVKIPAGVHDGSRVRLAGKGEGGYRGGPRGDLYVTTRVAPSPVFKQRPDGNLEVDLPVTVTEAIQGGDIEVPTLNGSKTIRISPGTQHGTVQRLRGEGPPQNQGLWPRRHLLPDSRRRARRSSPTSSGSRWRSSPSPSMAAIRAPRSSGTRLGPAQGGELRTDGCRRTAGEGKTGSRAHRPGTRRLHDLRRC